MVITLKRSELGVLGIRLFEDPFKLWLQVGQHGVDPVGAHVPEGERLPAHGDSVAGRFVLGLVRLQLFLRVRLQLFLEIHIEVTWAVLIHLLALDRAVRRDFPRDHGLC